MKIVVSICGYSPIERLTHYSVSQLLRCLEPQFFEAAIKPIAGADVFRSIVASRVVAAKDYDAVLFVDHDVVFDPKDVMSLVRSMKDGKNVIGGCYVTKSEHPQPSSRFLNGQTVVFKPGAAPVKIEYLAGGFMLVARNVLDTLSRKLPFCNSKENMGFWPFFMPFVKRHRSGLFKNEYEYLTEDYAFCDRAREAGFDIWLDPSIRLSHIGSFAYELEDADYMSKDKMPKPEISFTRRPPLVVV